MNEGVFFRIAVKRQAKVVFFKNLFKCTGITLIYLIVSFSLTLIQFPIQEQLNLSKNLYMEYFFSILPAFLSLLFISPVTLGFLEFCMRLADGKPVAIGDLFLWFGEGKRYLKSVLINLQFSFISSVIALIAFIIPASALYYCISMGYNSFSFILVSINLVIMVFVIAKIVTYLPGMFLLAEDSEKRPWKCLMESKKLFKKKKWDMVSFCFSFFGWFIVIFMIWSTTTVMEITNSGVMFTVTNGLIDPASISVALMLRATIRAITSVSVFLLYVVPYMTIASAYYIKGTLNPNLFHIPVPTGYVAKKNPPPDDGSSYKSADRSEDDSKQ